MQASFSRTAATWNSKDDTEASWSQGLNNVLNGLLLAVVANRTFALVDPRWLLPGVKDGVAAAGAEIKLFRE